jgi:hypothetical protein
MVNWLRKQSRDESIGMRYTILFHKLLGGHRFHKHGKGHPSKDRPKLDVVNHNMQVQILKPIEVSPLSVEPTPNQDQEAPEYLESLQFDGNTLEGNYVKSGLPPDGIYGKDVLSEDALQHTHHNYLVNLFTRHRVEVVRKRTFWFDTIFDGVFSFS